MSARKAWAWTAIWIAAALVFNLFVWLHFGAEAGEQFFAAYLLEKSLSVDNLFVFLVIFAAFRVPREEQRRILTWGILGALVARAIFIGAGAAILHRWHEVTYVFGAILIVTAIKTLRAHDAEPPKIIEWVKRRVGSAFLAALIAIEVTDILFAIDSIPAVFAITDDPLIVYSSNIFAILGLRALYIALAGALAELRYLRYGLAAVLAFAGGKMLAAPWVHFTPALSVAVIASCITLAVVASLSHRVAAARGAAKV
ncbi:MAG TPA: hypothetical protein VL463_11375 [Kofleriaceae bacterium]|jgi:tellurite resistance protein TerC|nr:hypothetical protein [Kofleriaceae bacterium]